MPSVGLAVSGSLHAAALAAVVLVALPGSAPVVPESVIVVDLVVLDEKSGRAVPSSAGGVEPSPARVEPPEQPEETDAADSDPVETPKTVSDGFDVPQNPVAEQGEEPQAGEPDVRLVVLARFQPLRKPATPVQDRPTVVDVPKKPVSTVKTPSDGSDGVKAAGPKPGPRGPVTARRSDGAAKPGVAAFSDARPVGGGIANPPPRYPFSARRRGQEGRVVLRVEVDTAGRAADVAVARSSGVSALDRAAADAVRRWRFQPARRGGVPVVGRIDVPILFRLDSSG